MALIKGIPFNWDGIEGDGLFGKSSTWLKSPQNISQALAGIQTNKSFEEMSSFNDSPFGKNWDKRFVLADWEKDKYEDDPPLSQWIYHLEKNADGKMLIDLYLHDSTIAKSYGSDKDNLTDISIYYETDDKDNIFGSVCFAKMNDALTEYLSKYSYSRKFLVDEIVKKENYKIDAKKLRSAIDYELEYGSGGIGIFNKIALGLLNKLAEEIRGWKYTRKNWDFNDKEYDPIIGSDIMRGIVSKWNSFQKKAYSFFKKCYNVAEWCRTNIPGTGEFLAKLIYSVVDFFTNILVCVDKFFSLIDGLNKFIAVLNAFVCGVLNELLEAAAGIMDLLALLVTLTNKAERELLTEALENMLSAYKNNPEKILDKLKETWNNIKAPYSADNNRYEKAYNAGEDFVDVILFVEILVGVIKLFKNIPKLLRNMERWVTEKGKQLSRLKKIIAKDIAVEDIDWIAKKKTIGNLGGKIVTVKQIRRLKEILSKYGITLVQEEKVVFKKRYRDLFFYMRSEGLVGGFNASTKEFFLTKGSTEIVVFHEQAHVTHWVQVGNEVYKGLTVLEKETYVWEQIYKNKTLWTKAELEDALKYINGKRKDVDLEPLKIK